MTLFPVEQNIRGPVAALGQHLSLRAEAIMDSPIGSVGRTRGLHIITMVERTGSSSTARKPGFFHSSLVDRLAVHLTESNARLRPEESRFRQITTWHDPDQIREEMRSNLHRLVDVPQDTCIKLALDMHVLHDLYMRHSVGFAQKRHHLTSADFYAHLALRETLGRCIQHVPEITLWSQLVTTVREIAEAA